MKVLIIYDSKTGNTEKMATAVAEGAKEAGAEVTVKKIGEPFPLTLLEESDGVAFGSPTRYADVTNDMKDFLSHVEDYVKLGKMKMKGRKAAVFGSYGYDGAWVMEDRFKRLHRSSRLQGCPQGLRQGRHRDKDEAKGGPRRVQDLGQGLRKDAQVAPIRRRRSSSITSLSSGASRHLLSRLRLSSADIT